MSVSMKPKAATVTEALPEAFERLKATVIRPVFESVGSAMKARAHDFSISEEPGGQISIHIMPPGVNRTIRRDDWFPTFSLFAASYSGTIGMHGRNMRPNSEPSSGSRGDYKPELLSREIVEKGLNKFIGEISNW
jgi:hypothetical protein